MLPRNIRNIIKQTFARLTPQHSEITAESLLIRDGHYCGHRFHSGSLSAVWFHEEDQIKFHGKEGNLLMVVRPSETEAEVANRAA